MKQHIDQLCYQFTTPYAWALVATCPENNNNIVVEPLLHVVVAHTRSLRALWPAEDPVGINVDGKCNCEVKLKIKSKWGKQKWKQSDRKRQKKTETRQTYLIDKLPWRVPSDSQWVYACVSVMCVCVYVCLPMCACECSSCILHALNLWTYRRRFYIWFVY